MTEPNRTRSVHDWLDEYGMSHTNPVNKIVHFVCVPLIMLSLIGLLWSIPTPAIFGDVPVPLNWATMFLLAALGYYAVLSVRLMIGMLPIALMLAALVYVMDTVPGISLWRLSIVVFVLAWVGQFVGHKIEGAKPSFFKDLQFLLIGPLWILAFVYRRLGVQY